MNDALALALEGTRFIQNFKGSLGAQSRHAARELQFVLRGFLHISGLRQGNSSQRQTDYYNVSPIEQHGEERFKIRHACAWLERRSKLRLYEPVLSRGMLRRQQL